VVFVCAQKRIAIWLQRAGYRRVKEGGQSAVKLLKNREEKKDDALLGKGNSAVSKNRAESARDEDKRHNIYFRYKGVKTRASPAFKKRATQRPTQRIFRA